MVKHEKVMFSAYPSTMKNSLVVLSVIFAFAGAEAVTAQDTLPSDFSCDISDEQTVYWAAMSQAVTLRTQLKTHDDSFPVGFMTLVLENGTEVDLGQGSKYLDDAPEAELRDCEILLEIAKADTLDSLSRKARFPTLTSLWAFSAMGQDCMDDANLPDDGPSQQCQEAASIHEIFMETSSETPMNYKQFNRLRDSGAPLITVRRSTYYSETYVYDPQTNKLHNVLTEGC